MKKLINGIVEFRKNISKENKQLFSELALGQKPDALFIACSDSRVVPNLFASTNPGDLFVLRHIGNLIPPQCSNCGENAPQAAIEFSLHNLKISNIIVCGHSECFAMTAIAENLKIANCPHLELWLKHGQEALAKVRQGLIFNPNLSLTNQVSQANVLLQMEHLLTYPFIRERVEAKTLKIHGWWFDIGHADVYCFEPLFNQFVLIDEQEAELILQRLS